MPLKIETVMLGPETQQYAGQGQSAMTIETIAASARRVEALGFDGATIPEAGHDPYVPVAIAAEHTERITIGTNVAIAFPRSPMATAQVAWDLQQLSGGRFNLGLGTQVKGHNERRYAAPWTAPPGPRLRDYLLCMRAMFDTFQHPKEPRYFEGEHYKFTMMAPFFNPGPIAFPKIPIYIAAVNTYMTRLVGELCDGVRLHPISTFQRTKEVLLPIIERAAAKAGRARSDIDVIGAPFLALGKDEAGVEKAKAATKQRISFYASTRTYHSVLEFHGWKDLGMQLHELSIAGKWQEMPALITDDMLQEFAVVGTYDDFVPALRARAEGVYDTIMLDLPPELAADDDRVRDIVRQLRA